MPLANFPRFRAAAVTRATPCCALVARAHAVRTRGLPSALRRSLLRRGSAGGRAFLRMLAIAQPARPPLRLDGSCDQRRGSLRLLPWRSMRPQIAGASRRGSTGPSPVTEALGGLASTARPRICPAPSSRPTAIRCRFLSARQRRSRLTAPLSVRRGLDLARRSSTRVRCRASLCRACAVNPLSPQLLLSLPTRTVRHDRAVLARLDRLPRRESCVRRLRRGPPRRARHPSVGRVCRSSSCILATGARRRRPPRSDLLARLIRDAQRVALHSARAICTARAAD